MKTYIFPILISALMLIFHACNKGYEEPDFAVPVYTGTPANKTLQDIINVYNNAGKMDSICHAGETFIVKATVVSSDEGGNFYKSMVLQDETAAIQMQINTSGLCHIYPVGQTVYLNCQGLVVGNYHGVYQIGWIYEGSVGRIDKNYLDRYLFKDGLPVDVSSMVTDITSPADLTPLNVNRLVRIKNCTFAGSVIGLPLAEETVTTNRAIADINNSECTNFVVRTSNYAKFRKHIIPAGTGDLFGILSVYNSTYQLILRTIDDMKSFGTISDVYPLTFNGAPNDWTITAHWEYFPRDSAMLHRGTETACDDWLISPPIPLSTVSGSDIYVEETFQNISGVNLDNFGIYYTTVLDGTPEESDWHKFTVTNYPIVDYVRVALTGLENPTSDFRIGFRYKSENACATSWAVKGLHFTKLIPN